MPLQILLVKACQDNGVKYLIGTVNLTILTKTMTGRSIPRIVFFQNIQAVFQWSDFSFPRPLYPAQYCPDAALSVCYRYPEPALSCV